MIDSLKKVTGQIEAAKRNKDNIRLMFQGLSLGTADEVEAFIRSSLSDNTYQDELKNVRGKIGKARENFPIQSTLSEAGGAVIPAIAGTALSPFTGGTSSVATAPSLLSLARAGSILGGAYGFGTGEGGLLERAKNAGRDAIVGAVTNPVATRLTNLVTRPISRVGQGLLNRVSNRMTSREGEVIKNVLNNIDVDQNVSQNVSQAMNRGNILAEIDPITTKTIKGQSTFGNINIPRLAGERLNNRIQNIQANLRKDFLPEEFLNKKNIKDVADKSIKEYAVTQNAKYESFFRDQNNTLKFVNSDTNNQVFEILNNNNFNKKIIKELNSFRTRKGTPPFFKKNKKGDYVPLRNASLQEAENVGIILREILNDPKKIGKITKSLGQDFNKKLTNKIDNQYPGMTVIRNQRKIGFKIKDGFDLYKKHGKNFEDFEVELGNLLKDLEKDEQAFVLGYVRTGFVKALEDRISLNKARAISSLDDMNKKDREILDLLYLGKDEAQKLNIINSIDTAVDAKRLNQVLGGTTTRAEQAQAERFGIMPSLSDATGIASSFATGNPIGAVTSVANIATRFFKRKKQPLTETEIQRITEALFSEDQNFVNDFVAGKKTVQQLEKQIDKTRVNLGIGAGASATVSGTQILEE
tara:strand:+ start:1274 stop:3193 length:1920 start_codon:yes stop_codon:yes gene_type:complete